MDACKCNSKSMNAHDHISHDHGKKEAVHEGKVQKAQPEHGENNGAQRTGVKEKPLENEAKRAAEDDDGVPYDRGWAWICVLSAFIMRAVVLGGYLKSFGVFFTAIVEQYNTTARATSWIPSLYLAFTLCSGPVVPVLVGMIDRRILAVTGGVLTGSGVLLTVFVPRVEYMYLTYGVMAGLGSGLCFNLCVTTMSRYFKKRLGLANGLAAAGSSIGAFVIPLLFSVTLNHYGFFGAFLLFASFGFHLCICGALLRPPEQYMNRRRKRTDQPKSPAHNEVQQRSFNITSVFFDASVLDVRMQIAEGAETLKFPTLQLGLKAVLEGKIGPNGTLSAARDGVQGKRCCCSWRCRQRATSGDASRTSKRVNVDFSLFKERVFWIYVFVVVYTFTTYPSIFYMISANAEQLGFSKTQAAFLISVHGGTDFVGRVLLGFVADLKFMRTSLLFSLNLGFMGVTCFLFPISKKYVFLTAVSALNGLTAGSFIPLLPNLLANTFGPNRLPGAYGLITFFIGISMILGAPIIGFLRDKTQNWHATFYLMGCLTILGALTMLLELTVTAPKCIRDRKNKYHCNETLDVGQNEGTFVYINKESERSEAPCNGKSDVEQNKETLYDGSNKNNDFSLTQMNGLPSSAEGRDVLCSGAVAFSGNSGILADWKPNNSDGSFRNKAFDANLM